MISVLFLIPTLDRGGAENVLVDLVNHMDQSKFQITVQTLFDKDSQKDRLREGIEYRSFLYHQFHGNSRLFARIPAGLLYRLIVRKRYDIVVSYLEGPTSHIIAGCPYANTKSVAWFHSALTKERGFRAGFSSKEAALKAYQEFDAVVFVAKAVRESIEKTAGVHFSKGHVLYNTINTEAVIRGAKEPVTNFPFSKQEYNIISTGKIAYVKGYDRLARIQKKLHDSGLPTHVYILGAGPERTSIEKFILENGISDSFTFLGFQENPYKYVAKADLFVCSSRREGFSTAVTEALLVGTPVCTTDVSGMREMLGNDEYGLIVSNSEEALYEGIKRLLEDQSLLEYYRGQARIRGNFFSTEKTVKAVEEMLTGLWKHDSIRKN